MRKFFDKFLIVMLLVACCFTIGCKKDEISNETTRLRLASQELDGVFNPFYSTAAADGEIVGMTQISMLSADKYGKVAYGKDEACVVLDYEEFTEGLTDDDKITTYRFVLKNNVKFSDGVALTMKDVLFNLYEYLDPQYYGSATIYSTDIVGLAEYRTQTDNKNEQDNFNDTFYSMADDRVQRLVDIADMVNENAKSEGKTLTQTEYRQKLVEQANEFGDDYKTVAEDFDLACQMFKEELENDYTNNMSTYDSITYTDKNGKEVKLSNDTEAFLFNEGFISWNKKEYKFEYSFGEDSKNWDRNTAIERVYVSKIPMNVIEVVSYWGTATELKDKFMNAEKESYLASVERDYKNISGVSFANRTASVSVNGTTYNIPEYNTDGSVKEGSNEVLEIKIHGVDPKAIWNFAFTVAPMHYYSTPEVYEKFDYVENFGVKYNNIEFQDTVIKDINKIGVPMGAGPYKACNKYGDSDNIDGTAFKEHNVVYFQRNDYFLLGAPKIKYINYQVIPTNQLETALFAGEVDFVSPTCKQEVINNIESHKSEGFDKTYVMTNGYGYIGINAAKVPDLEVRQAIMHAINIQLCLDFYPGYSSAIYRPMTKASWAYPENINEQYYTYDETGKTSEDLVIAAGYTKNSNGVYTKNGHTLKYTFTIAGDTTTHPAYLALQNAANILNAHGFDVSVYPDTNALKKLSTGALTVWAAAWGAGVDPDMYQVYHMKSTATSTSNWGYKAILQNRTKYAREYAMVVELSDMIDAARETTVEKERKAIYAEALDKVMEMAVELPTYQRSDLYAYNTKRIDVNSMTPANDITPYNGPISKIWELSLNESK